MGFETARSGLAIMHDCSNTQMRNVLSYILPRKINGLENLKSSITHVFRKSSVSIGLTLWFTGAPTGTFMLSDVLMRVFIRELPKILHGAWMSIIAVINQAHPIPATGGLWNWFIRRPVQHVRMRPNVNMSSSRWAGRKKKRCFVKINLYKSGFDLTSW